MAEPRLVMMTTDAVGGVWHYTLTLATELSARGVSVALVVLGPAASPAQKSAALAVPHLSLFEQQGALEWMDDPWRDVQRASAFLLQLSAQLRPDIVHLNGYCHAELDFGAPKLLVAHSCVLSWWQAVERSAPPARLETYRTNVSRGIHAADLVVAPSASMLLALTAHYGAPRAARVIPNGSSFGPGARESDSLKEPLILSVGRMWDRAKNVAALSEAAPALPWPVYVAGEVDRSWPGLHPLGVLDGNALAGWYARASVYAHPARYEPYGLSVLEAARAGCALVLGDIPSLHEIWADAAFYVPPESPLSLRRALFGLTRDEAWRATLAERARARARRFQASAMALAYLDAYREMRRSAHASARGAA